MCVPYAPGGLAIFFQVSGTRIKTACRKGSPRWLAPSWWGRRPPSKCAGGGNTERVLISIVREAVPTCVPQKLSRRGPPRSSLVVCATRGNPLMVEPNIRMQDRFRSRP